MTIKAVSSLMVHPTTLLDAGTTTAGTEEIGSIVAVEDVMTTVIKSPVATNVMAIVQDEGIVEGIVEEAVKVPVEEEAIKVPTVEDMIRLTLEDLASMVNRNHIKTQFKIDSGAV